MVVAREPEWTDTSMEIGIDARIAGYSSAGIARFARGLIAGLGELCSESAGGELPRAVVYRALRERFPVPVPKPLSSRRLLTPPHFPFEALTLPFELRAARLLSRAPDLFHALDFYAPVPRRLPLMLTVYDLYFLRDESAREGAVMDTASRRHYGRLLEWLPRAAHTVCTSHDTARELSTLGLVDPSRVSVVYPGIDGAFAPITEAEREAARRRWNLPKGCVLFVSTIEPRKNLPQIVRSYLSVRSRHPELPPLCVVGREGYRGAAIRDECEGLARRAGASALVRFLGGVTERELAGLYGVATALHFVTLAEGFGFPIVEAMSAGVPVVTASSSASAEVAGDAAILVSPFDVPKMADALETVLFHGDERTRCIQRGLERAATFRWRRAASDIVHLYRRVLGGKSEESGTARAPTNEGYQGRAAA